MPLNWVTRTFSTKDLLINIRDKSLVMTQLLKTNATNIERTKNTKSYIMRISASISKLNNFENGSVLKINASIMIGRISINLNFEE